VKNEIIVGQSLPLLLLLAGCFVFTSVGLIYLYRKEKINQEFEQTSWFLIPIGLLLSLLSLIPFYAGGFEVSLDFPCNRFFLAMLPGISLFSVGVIDFFFRTDKIKNFVLSTLCVLAIGAHFFVGTEFVQQWNKQADLMRQLSWRVPALK